MIRFGLFTLPLTALASASAPSVPMPMEFVRAPSVNPASTFTHSNALHD
jgi:hypothetical protein